MKDEKKSKEKERKGKHQTNKNVKRNSRKK